MRNLNININGAKKGLVTPPVPTLGTPLVISDTQINIPVTSSYPYEMWYSTDDVTYTKHGDGTTTPYEATGLTAGTLYYFKARGVNGSKYSDYSGAVSETTIAGTGLTGRYYQVAEGGDLIDYLGGVSIPYVSGSGLDQLFDFSVLNDNRFDKGSYVGNAFGLPETYNFPYVDIYYDATSETTRHYWKITDFAYAVILRQSLLADDMFFLKAKATTNISNVIASWSELLIYSTAQATTNLALLKTYIGIQADFYGNNILTNILASGGFTNAGDYYLYTAYGTTSLLQQLNIIAIGFIYKTTYTILENPENVVLFFPSTNYTGTISPIDTSVGTKNYEQIAIADDFYIRANAQDASNLKITNINIKRFYTNYYTS